MTKHDPKTAPVSVEEVPHGLSRSEIAAYFVPREGAQIESPQKFFEFPDDADDGKTYGIDVSHHKGVINWQKVASAGSKFSYAKATEGRTFVDHRFDENHPGARVAGLPVGAYHFLSHGTPPRDQAGNFINVYGPLREADDLPPVLDLEWDRSPSTGRDRWEGQSGQQIVDKCLEWLSVVEGEYGVRPLIYTNKFWWESRLGDEGLRLAGFKIWMSRYGKFGQSEPPMPDGLTWAIWQFTEHGTTPGVSGRVDVNFTAPGFDISQANS